MRKPASDANNAKIKPYDGPAGGWGSARSVGKYLLQEEAPVKIARTLLKQNKPDGFACVSCAWAKPEDSHPLEFCENGAKATAWEITAKRIKPDFFAQHSCRELETWPDHDLEAAGRLTQPMRWDENTDTYVPVAWDDAFADIGAQLQAMDPKSVVFYVSGRASLETSYMYQLFARIYGSNNLPDSSNMCHESTSVGLPESIGVPVGTATHEDFEATDCILYLGHNLGTNSPRMLHEFRDVRKRDVPIISFNPMRERALERFTDPQNPIEMLTLGETKISTQYHLLRAGSDIAALTGICKALIEADDRGEPILDHDFITEHTHGFEDFADFCRAQEWEVLEKDCGLTRVAMKEAANVYGKAKTAIAAYGMGLTQHTKGTENVQMVVNLLLLRGNIGKPGAGICPIRGHSNVQGQRTVGITEKPELVPLAKLEEQYGFTAPREKGLNTVEACKGILDGEINAFIGLGGNFIRAIPETVQMEEAWRKLPLTVQISTKLNRNHLIHGKVSYILPCLGRIEIDEQRTGPQAVSMEDSTAYFHGSRGQVRPASPYLKSEAAIVAGLAKATLQNKGKVNWDAWVDDYSLIRDSMEETWDVMFKDFNKRLFTPGGFPRPLAARNRHWHTPTGRANFIVPHQLIADTTTEKQEERAPEVLRLITLRSNDQFNTTIYGYSDRFRGVEGTRMVVFMNSRDIARFGFKDGETVTIETAAGDNVSRSVSGFRIVTYDVADGCCAAYYPECNPLVPLWHHAEKSFVPAVKSVPVRVIRNA